MKSSTRWAVGAIAVAALLTVCIRPGSGQTVVAAGAVGQPRMTVLFQGERERLGGYWFGGTLELTVGPVTVSGSMLRGQLDPIDETQALEREGGEVQALVRVSPVSWFGFEGGYTVRRFNSSAGSQEWRIPRVGAVLSGTLGHQAIRTHVKGSYSPLVNVPGIDSPDLGFALEAGLTLTPSNTPLYMSAQYRLERYDFPGGAASRLEQFEMLSVSAGFKFGR